MVLRDSLRCSVPPKSTKCFHERFGRFVCRESLASRTLFRVHDLRGFLGCSMLVRDSLRCSERWIRINYWWTERFDRFVDRASLASLASLASRWSTHSPNAQPKWSQSSTNQAKSNIECNPFLFLYCSRSIFISNDSTLSTGYCEKNKQNEGQRWLATTKNAAKWRQKNESIGNQRKSKSPLDQRNVKESNLRSQFPFELKNERDWPGADQLCTPEAASRRLRGDGVEDFDRGGRFGSSSFFSFIFSFFFSLRRTLGATFSNEVETKKKEQNEKKEKNGPSQKKKSSYVKRRSATLVSAEPCFFLSSFLSFFLSFFLPFLVYPRSGFLSIFFCLVHFF